MTVEICLDACQAQQYTLAGLQYGQECWCSPLPATTTLPDEPLSNCAMPCNGNAQEYCGGPLWNAIYGFVPNFIPPAQLSGFNSLGCLNVEDLSDFGQLFTPFATSPIDIETCVATCAANGFTFGGPQEGDECWCASAASLPTSLPTSSTCDIVCPGNLGEHCGGPDGMTAYLKAGASLGPPSEIAGFHLVGCFEHEFADWDSNWTGLLFTPNSLTECVAACAAGGFTLGGPSVGDECWCGHAFTDPFIPATCDLLCADGSGNVCGGSRDILLYQKDGTPPVHP